MNDIASIKQMDTHILCKLGDILNELNNTDKLKQMATESNKYLLSKRKDTRLNATDVTNLQALQHLNISGMKELS